MKQDILPSFSSLAQSFVIGDIYEHYKGLRYKILSIARHSETLEEMVVYQALYGERDVWVRPISMFVENVTFSGVTAPRFKLVSTAS